MALSGSFNNYPVSSFGLYCEWSAIQNIIGNYSSVTLKTYLSYYSINVGERDDGSSSINGTSATFTTQAINDSPGTWKKRLINTQTVTVLHNTNGQKSCALSASWRFDGTYSGTSVGTITASQTVTLNAIDRLAPTVNISVSSITPTSAYVSASASTTCDVWQYSKDGGSTWTNYSTSSATSAGVTISGLTPNTTYSVKVRARKKTNQVYGTSAASSVKTLGPAVLNSVSTVTADNTTATIAINWTVYSTAFTYTLAVKKGTTVLATISIAGQGSTGTKSTTLTLTSTQRSAILAAMSTVKSFSGSFVLTTYNGSSVVGSASSKTATVQTTAANSAPTFSNAAGFTYLDSNAATAAITENNQIMIQGYSTLAVTAYAATARNGASITQYQATINGAVISSSGTTLNCGSIAKAGSLALKVTAVDSRGYSVSVQKTIVVTAYTKPDITELIMRRVNEVEATTQVELAATLSKVIVTSVNKNSCQYFKYRYKKTSETSYGNYTTIPAESLTITDTSVEFESNEFILLDADYSYNIQFYLADRLSSDSYTVTLPAGTPLVSKRRKAVGINNRSPLSALDVVGLIRQNAHGVMGFVKALTTDNLDTCISQGVYTQLLNANATSGLNYPVGYAGWLEVMTHPGGYIYQRYSTYNNGVIYTRVYYNSTWGNWRRICGSTILWSGVAYPLASHTLTLSEPISEQPTGIELVFSAYSGGAAKNYNYNSFFVSKSAVASALSLTGGSTGRNFILSTSNFGHVAAKYLYINDTTVVGHDDNNLIGTANGIAYENNAFVLRYIIGV